jgi:hypothetical protein
MKRTLAFSSYTGLSKARWLRLIILTQGPLSLYKRHRDNESVLMKV